MADDGRFPILCYKATIISIFGPMFPSAPPVLAIYLKPVMAKFSPCLHAADRSDGAEGLEEAAQGVVISLLILGVKNKVPGI